MKTSTQHSSIPMLALLLILNLPSIGWSQLPSKSQTEQLKQLLTLYHDNSRFNGVVLVAQNGKKLLSEGYGYANLEWKVPNSPEQKYMLASVSKTFTASLIFRLIDQGKLSLETTLSEALPWYRKEVGQRVTVRQLLNHTSGIPNYMNMKVNTIQDLNREFGSAVIDKIAFAKKYCSGNLEFEPGTQWNYNNSAYFLLALIAEQVTGMPFDRAMQKLIFEPLNMSHSGDVQPNPQQVVDHLATGYLKKGVDFSHMEYWNLSTALGAGSLYSTLDDLMKFDLALQNPTFLSDKAREAMFTPGVNNYGCGWELRETALGAHQEVKKIQTHEGFLWGWHTRIFRIPQDGYFVVIISNTGDTPLEKMFKGITDVLYGRKPYLPKASLAFEVERQYKRTGIDGAIVFGKQQLATGAGTFELAENELNAMGYRLLQSGSGNDAVRVFGWITELFPQSWNAWDSYGEGLAATGKKAAALEAYHKSVALNPEHKAGLEMIHKLENEL